MKIKKYEVELLKFIELYKELSGYCKNGVILTPYTDGFNNLDYKKKSFIEKMNENNISGFVALVKDYFIHETNKDENQWKFWGCKVPHLKNLIEILSEYNLIMRVDNIKEKFENFYGKNNIRFSSLSDDEDANGGKIERFEIIINNEEVVTLESYEDGEVDVIIDDVKINKDNLPLYYEFMTDEDKKEHKHIIDSSKEKESYLNALVKQYDNLSLSNAQEVNIENYLNSLIKEKNPNFMLRKNNMNLYDVVDSGHFVVTNQTLETLTHYLGTYGMNGDIKDDKLIKGNVYAFDFNGKQDLGIFEYETMNGYIYTPLENRNIHRSASNKNVSEIKEHSTKADNFLEINKEAHFVENQKQKPNRQR